MTTFQIVILMIFVTTLSAQFVIAIEHERFGLSIVFAFEIIAFVYLAKVLM